MHKMFERDIRAKPLAQYFIRATYERHARPQRKQGVSAEILTLKGDGCLLIFADR